MLFQTGLHYLVIFQMKKQIVFKKIKMRGEGFEPSDPLRNRISHLPVSVPE